MYQNRKTVSVLFSGLMILALMLALFAPTSIAKADDGAGLDNSGDGSTPGSVELSGPQAQVIYPDGVEVIPGQYVVVYKSGYVAADSADSIKVSVAANGGNVTFVYDAALNGFAAYLPEKALNAVLADPNVDYVEADGYVHLDQDEVSAADVTTEGVSAETTQASATWGIDRIDQHILPLDSKYFYTYTGAGVNAYVIDTGIRTTHTQFGGRATFDYDAIDGTKVDCNGHGTHVAGTIGGSTYGVAKGVKLHAVRVLDCSGSGSYSQVIAGVNWVASHAVKPAVASMSLGGSAYSALDTAINNLINKGVTVVVAAGNDSKNACNYSPARVPNAVTVAATTNTDTRASYSNYGSCVDIFAPGSDITSAWNTSNTATNTISGTSMATPHVTGVVALYLQAHKTASVSSVVSVLKSKATTGLVKSPGTGSPNRLLYSHVNGEYSKTAILVSPRGLITDNTPTFKWGKVDKATSSYQLVAYKGSTVALSKTLTTSSCSGYTCSYTIPTAMTRAAYTWKVRAYIGGWQAYTAPVSFTITTPGKAFTSLFTSNAADWAPVKGAWSVTSGWYNTPGIYGKFASTKHTGVYTNVSYTARMRRLSDSSSANSLYVRATPTLNSSDYTWKNGYMFSYTNNGYFSIWVAVNGTYTSLVSWTTTSYINPYAFNILQVKMQGTSLKFYLNGHLVAYGTDSTIPSGQLGIACYESVSGAKLSVDYAKAATSFTMAASDDVSGAVLLQPNPESGQSPFMAPQ